MTIKKEYQKGDNAWIHGIGVKNDLTKGTVVAILDLSNEGYYDIQYVIEIPTHIEPLLEVRSWQTMSQDEKGPIGSLRNIKDMVGSSTKKISHLGFKPNFRPENNEPSPEEIMAALEKSASDLVHKPLHIKEPKPKRKYYPRKKK